MQVQPILFTALAGHAACPPIRPEPIVSAVNLIVANPLGLAICYLVLGFVSFVGIFRRTEAIPLAEHFVRGLARLSEAIGVQVSR